jgi:hypothetical protein
VCLEQQSRHLKVARHGGKVERRRHRAIERWHVDRRAGAQQQSHDRMMTVLDRRVQRGAPLGVVRVQVRMAFEQLDEELQLIVARRVPVGRGRRGEHLHAR